MFDIAWAAGIFEGEGTCWHRPGKSGLVILDD
jgi:hypothetical protein